MRRGEAKRREASQTERRIILVWRLRGLWLRGRVIPAEDGKYWIDSPPPPPTPPPTFEPVNTDHDQSQHGHVDREAGDEGTELRRYWFLSSLYKQRPVLPPTYQTNYIYLVVQLLPKMKYFLFLCVGDKSYGVSLFHGLSVSLTACLCLYLLNISEVLTVSFRVVTGTNSLQRNAGNVHLWSKIAWNWKGMASKPMMTSAIARLAMYMLVTVLILLKMMMYITRLFPVTATKEVVTYKKMKNIFKMLGKAYRGFSPPLYKTIYWWIWI